MDSIEESINSAKSYSDIHVQVVKLASELSLYIKFQNIYPQCSDRIATLRKRNEKLFNLAGKEGVRFLNDEDIAMS